MLLCYLAYNAVYELQNIIDMFGLGSGVLKQNICEESRMLCNYLSIDFITYYIVGFGLPEHYMTIDTVQIFTYDVKFWYKFSKERAFV